MYHCLIYVILIILQIDNHVHFFKSNILKVVLMFKHCVNLVIVFAVNNNNTSQAYFISRLFIKMFYGS